MVKAIVVCDLVPQRMPNVLVQRGFTGAFSQKRQLKQRDDIWNHWLSPLPLREWYATIQPQQGLVAV